MSILLVILGLLVLLMLVPVGADAEYCDDQFRAYVRIGGITVPIYPKKRSVEKKSKPKQEKAKKQMPDLTREEILDGISILVSSVKKLKFSLHKLRLHFISAFGNDPYRTAMIYGYANAAVSALNMQNWKRTDVQLAVDFERESIYLDIYLSVTIKIYYICKLLVCLVCGAIPILWRRHKRLKTKENSTAVKGKVA